MKKSERVGVLGCKGTILVEFSAIRNKKISKQKAKRCKKEQKKGKAAPQMKKRKGEKKNSEVLTFFKIPLLSCMHCLLELDLIQV